MRILITGLRGTVAPALAAHLTHHAHTVLPWNRETDPPTDEPAVRTHIEHTRPNWICHIATGPPDWAEWIARACRDLAIPLLWTGSVSIFGNRHTPPFTPDMEPDATDDYARYKIECERRVRTANPDAVIARLGWQIGLQPGSNTMTNHLANLARDNDNRIDASTRWTPSCAFLPDTAAALASLIHQHTPGTYHLEGNTNALSFFDIATRLAHTLDMPWQITPSDTPHMDNRMTDPRLRMAQIDARL